MSAIFESKTLAPTERLVMLALADHADDAGRCYPSVSRLCDRTGLSERAVQSNVRKLVGQGYIKVIPGGGKSKSNVYFVTANPAVNAPNSDAIPRTTCPPQEMHPAADAPQTPQLLRSNPAADAPEPSGTIIGTVNTEAAATREPDLVLEILHALGFDRGQQIPRYWIASDTGLIVAKWTTELRLTGPEIVHVARQNAIQFGKPANGPKILNRHMADFAAAKAAPPLTPTDPTKPKGRSHGKSDGQKFGEAIHRLADDLSAGRVQLSTEDRNPFALRSGQDAEAG